MTRFIRRNKDGQTMRTNFILFLTMQTVPYKITIYIKSGWRIFIVSVYILMIFDFPFVRLFGVRKFCYYLYIVSSAIDITVSLNFTIGSVAFRIISVWSFPLHICSYRGQSALSNWYLVGFSPIVEFKLSRIMGKWWLPHRASWTFHEKSRRRYGSATSIAE